MNRAKLKKKKSLQETKARQQGIVKFLSQLGLVAIVILPSSIFFLDAKISNLNILYRTSDPVLSFVSAIGTIFACMVLVVLQIVIIKLLRRKQHTPKRIIVFLWLSFVLLVGVCCWYYIPIYEDAEISGGCRSLEDYVSFDALSASVVVCPDGTTDPSGHCYENLICSEPCWSCLTAIKEKKWLYFIITTLVLDGVLTYNTLRGQKFKNGKRKK